MKAHQESTKHIVSWLMVMCQADEQLLFVLRQELQNHVKLIAEYNTIISDLLPELVKINA